MEVRADFERLKSDPRAFGLVMAMEGS